MSKRQSGHSQRETQRSWLAACGLTKVKLFEVSENFQKTCFQGSQKFETMRKKFVRLASCHSATGFFLAQLGHRYLEILKILKNILSPCYLRNMLAVSFFKNSIKF